ncbi:mRpL50 [Drosophila busckii]|uniref:Large ribosomal subunit protein mL50 n=1 Tax=Drosophila busckii TaxID=30019 RepID=A0A0M5J0W1_DROBS|nr:39S ribosomal protein L50, mitochondrial [Drosophila busckii]ALC44498.1 mRpL50 [Drosophila busckii]
MAAVNLRKGIFVKQIIAARLQRCYATAKQQKTNTLAAVGESIASKGFLRPHKPYAPPKDAAERVRAIAAALQLNKSGGDQQKLTELEDKFKLLSACFEELKHGVPNSQVHEINTIADVVAFYEKPVDTTVPLDALKRIELPENLHIQHEYLRFHPDTDTKFNGKSAFPKSSTLVTGLKYRRKYEGHEAKRSWP